MAVSTAVGQLSLSRYGSKNTIAAIFETESKKRQIICNRSGAVLDDTTTIDATLLALFAESLKAQDPHKGERVQHLVAD